MHSDPVIIAKDLQLGDCLPYRRPSPAPIIFQRMESLQSLMALYTTSLVRLQPAICGTQIHFAASSVRHSARRPDTSASPCTRITVGLMRDALGILRQYSRLLL